MRKTKRRRRLTLDVSTLLDDQWTGIPVFARRLASGLLRVDQLDVKFICGTEAVPKEYVLSALRTGNGVVLHEFLRSHSRRRYGRTRSLGPMLFPSVKRACGLISREASTVHDLSTLLMPENHLDTNVKHHLEHFAAELRTDEVVFCVSEATKAALSTVLPAVARKTRVIYQYVDWPKEFAYLDDNLPGLRLGRYAVVVGTIEPRKNLRLILDSLRSDSIANSDIRFVVIGRQGWKTETFLTDLTPDQRARILFTGFVTDFIKYRLIRHCEFLVYPSLYEGFGIPALEALSLGKPVLAARTSSFPEVIGNAGVFFDPLSVDEFAAAFAEIQNPRRLSELTKRAPSQSDKFHWQRMVAPVVDWVG
jgi:glycosyltransferase involved in cell wall biosynthesis